MFGFGVQVKIRVRLSISVVAVVESGSGLMLGRCWVRFRACFVVRVRVRYGVG